jgi:hypothetical protein
VIELTEVEANEMAKNGLVEYKVKEVKTKTKND